MVAGPEGMRKSPGMISDPISDIVALVEARSIMTGSLAASGEWTVRFPVPARVKLYAILRGTCWLERGKRITLRAGDVALVSGPHEYIMENRSSFTSLFKKSAIFLKAS